MSIEIKGLRNYSATVIKVPKVRKAEDSDNLYIIDALGMTAIVDKSWVEREGELAIIFPAETQLHHEYLSSNNLYRDAALNADTTQTGYIENNRRVRAIKLRGNISNGLVLSLDSLGKINTAYDVSQFSAGDVFDTYCGGLICWKYEIVKNVAPLTNKQAKQQRKAFKRVDEIFLPQHYDTAQWFRESHTLEADDELIITQKLHGTSVRLANTIVKRKLTKREKFAQKFLGANISETYYDYVAGSRKVIKDPKNGKQEHWYGTDVWTKALEKYKDQIPKGYIVYGELVGYTEGGGAIQAGHTYECEPGENELYVYRVAIINEDARMIDLSWDQVRMFCKDHGLKNVPELGRDYKEQFEPESFDEKAFATDMVYDRMGYAYDSEDTPVALSPGGTGKDEGIAIRVERSLQPEFFKIKNKSHYEYETKQLDTGEVDMESAS